MTMAGWGQEGSAGITEGAEVRGYQTEGQEDGATKLLTFGWEPSAMVEREKLSLCSSDGVRYLRVRREGLRAATPTQPPPTFWGDPGFGGPSSGCLGV